MKVLLRSSAADLFGFRRYCLPPIYFHSSSSSLVLSPDRRQNASPEKLYSSCSSYCLSCPSSYQVLFAHSGGLRLPHIHVTASVSSEIPKRALKSRASSSGKTVYPQRKAGRGYGSCAWRFARRCLQLRCCTRVCIMRTYLLTVPALSNYTSVIVWKSGRINTPVMIAF
jgi:hypothetical protein